MRSMTVFNYLLEATLFGSVLILLVFAVRLMLRNRLGSRAVYIAWLLVALRLLLPFSLPNPAMDEFRPGFSTDAEARPVADQVRQRVIDAGRQISSLLGTEEDGVLQTFTQRTDEGRTGRWVLLVWAGVGAGTGGWLLWRMERFARHARRNRVRALEGEELKLYHELCRRCKVKPIPVYYVDRLAAGCVAGVLHPFIGIPLQTPIGHLELLLSHQLCHLRAHDPLWGLVRCLCCALHWFNPLVWMAAWVSWRDSELACDDRVTAGLSDLERLAYADVIASAGRRSGAAMVSADAVGHIETLAQFVMSYEINLNIYAISASASPPSSAACAEAVRLSRWAHWPPQRCWFSVLPPAKANLCPPSRRCRLLNGPPAPFRSAATPRLSPVRGAFWKVILWAKIPPV